MAAMALACSLAAMICAPARGDEGAPPAAPPAAEPLQPARPTPGAIGHSRHRAERQRIDEAVSRMARSLDLDANQQHRLRGVLEEEHRELRKLRTESTPPDADRAGMTRAILDRTRQQIRDLLTEEQRKKYPDVTPRDLLGPTHTDLDQWLRATQAKPPAPSGGTTP